eukprot:7324589-Pyramimonas_sp.AAC.1
MGPSASRLAAQSAFACPVASNHRAWRSAAHILSEKHYEMSEARCQDGWPDPNTFVTPGNLWSN